jgi:hypothetical protein
MGRFSTALILSWRLFRAALGGNACAWATNGAKGNWMDILEGDAVAYNQALSGTLLTVGERLAILAHKDSVELEAEEAVKELVRERD